MMPTLPLMPRDEARCSFCGKTKQRVGDRLVFGPGVNICAECVELCVQVLREGASKTPPDKHQDVWKLIREMEDQR
jgi:ATP-dependent protease Clp ATPase subunit